jgi:hypothetical protein
MQRVEVTLNCGAQVVFHTKRIVRQIRVSTGSSYLSWSTHQEEGLPSLLYLDMDQTAAVVTYELGSVDVSGGQDERDTEAAEPGGEELDLERDVEDRDPEEDSRE